MNTFEDKIQANTKVFDVWEQGAQQVAQINYTYNGWYNKKWFSNLNQPLLEGHPGVKSEGLDNNTKSPSFVNILLLAITRQITDNFEQERVIQHSISNFY